MKKSVLLRQREERRLLAGHFWIFSNEIASVEASPAAGDVVEVLRHDGKFLGVGFYHPHSLIAVRLLSQDRCDADHAFFLDRIGRAARLRERLFPDDTAYRVVHSESDFLPGLIVDRYGPCLAVQALSAGMESRIDTVCDVLEEIFHPDAIIARNDSPLRALEHLPQATGTL
ncbi:MAG: class I SAM-dependent rRNA methyltransferase, partial [Bacteroidota bacterium]